MKLSTAFKNTTFAKVFEVLETYYEDAEKNKTGYEKAFTTLQKMKISNKKEVDFEILLEKNKYGQEAGKDNFHVYGKNKVDKLAYALDFTTWENWLAADIYPETLKKYHYKAIVAHCLWEMTYHGFTNNANKAYATSIKTKLEKINKIEQNYLN